MVKKVNAIDTSGLVPKVKIPNVSNLVKKAEMESTRNGKKYFSTSNYNKFTSNILDAKIA